MRAGKNIGDMYEAYCQSLLVDAPFDFDSYMTYMEIDRPPQERFYQPRKKQLKPVVEALQALEDNELDELFLSMPPRVGKALADDTPILTRKGWKNHGDLVVGDEVIGMDGKFKKVIAVHPKCQLDVLVEFTNGETIQCHENHEWLFYDRAKQRETLRETHEYEAQKLESGEPGKRGHRYRFQVPKKKYVEGERKNLPLDPYALGVWLGDGANRNPRIANDKHDYAIIQKMVDHGLRIRWQTEHKITHVMYYDFDMRKPLQEMGLCHSRKRMPKRIPDVYLTASIEQRLELLAGLLDTDGSFREKENRYVFTTVEESLRDSFVELISTFGWRHSIVVYSPKVSSSGVVGKRDTYCVGFNPDCEIPCALERKQNHRFSKPRAIAVKSIKRVEPKQGNCITVEGGMYLAGRTMLPTHNTTLILFYVTWLIGKHPEASNLYITFSDGVAKVFYSGILEIITDPVTYHWKNVFPHSPLVSKNAADYTVNIKKKNRYPSITCRSIDGTLNGACDCSGLLIGDDLCSGYEEAISKDRMIRLWGKVDNNMLPRAKQTAKHLWIGTRWSIIDPEGLRISLLESDKKFSGVRYKVVNVPALNENDESNFDYDYGVGFDTAYYHQRRASFEHNDDMASWFAQYMGQPVERMGSLFTSGEIRFYNGDLPEKQPDRRFMAVDPAFGGGDAVAAPVCIMYDDEVYIPEVVYSFEGKRISMELLAQAIQKYGIELVQFEANKTLESYVQEFQNLLRERKIRCTVQMKPASTNKSKHQRIMDKAPDIREHMIFLEPNIRKKHYQQFMDNVYSFKIYDEKQHDDAPDSLAMAISMVFRFDNHYAYTFRRMF